MKKFLNPQHHTVYSILLFVITLTTSCNKFHWTHESTDYSVDREIEEIRKKSEGNLPKENLIINVDFYGVERANLELFQTVWQYVDKNVVIQGGDILIANGLRVAVADDNFRTIWIQNFYSVKNTEKKSANLVVLSGYTGSIFVGEQIPLKTIFLWHSPGVLIQSYEFRNVGFSLEVSPRIIQGDIIELTIIPIISHVVDGLPQTIKFTQLQTTLVVERGKRVIIGSYQDSSDTLGQTFFSRAAGRTEKKQLIVLTVK